MRRHSHSALGYSFIELLIVMTVLGILATAAMPLVELSVKRNKERELKAALWEIRRAIDAYSQAWEAGRIEKGGSPSSYPPELASLVKGVPDATPGKGGQPLYFLRRIPRDPFASAAVPAEQSWGLRSYASAPDQPKPGRDVFDVYSQSEEVGMNGVPYKQW